MAALVTSPCYWLCELIIAPNLIIFHARMLVISWQCHLVDTGNSSAFLCSAKSVMTTTECGSRHMSLVGSFIVITIIADGYERVYVAVR